jgi:hypothetical protein
MLGRPRQTQAPPRGKRPRAGRGALWKAVSGAPKEPLHLSRPAPWRPPEFCGRNGKADWQTGRWAGQGCRDGQGWPDRLSAKVRVLGSWPLRAKSRDSGWGPGNPRQGAWPFRPQKPAPQDPAGAPISPGTDPPERIPHNWNPRTCWLSVFIQSPSGTLPGPAHPSLAPWASQVSVNPGRIPARSFPGPARYFPGPSPGPCQPAFACPYPDCPCSLPGPSEHLARASAPRPVIFPRSPVKCRKGGATHDSRQ